MPSAKNPGRSFIGARALATIHTCPHFWQLQCFEDDSKTVQPSEGMKRIIERGKQFEEEIVSKLACEMPSYDIEKPWEGVEPTKDLMRQGVNLIYQGVLKKDRIFGIPDLLEKVSGKSLLGNYYYRPVDVKSHAKVQKKDKLQLAAYALVLEDWWKAPIKEGVLYLSSGNSEVVTVEEEIEEIKESFKTALQIEKQKLNTYPYPCSECQVCNWSDYCEQERRELRSITLLPGLNAKTAKKLITGKVDTYDLLAEINLKELTKQFELKAGTAEDLIRKAMAWKTMKPQVIQESLSIPENKTIIHYDIETFEDTLYLHGLFIEGDKNPIRQFVAKNPNEEEQALAEFLACLSEYPNAVVFTWTTFENRWLEKMKEKYAQHESKLSKLLSQLVDLKEVIKDAVALPVTSFSIKEVAPALGFSWRAEDAGGSNSEAWYENWLSNGDEGLFQKILHYNEDDVLAMEFVLRKVKEALKI